MNKKIIMLFNCPFIEGFIKKYCLNEIISLGHDLEIVDLSSVLEKEYENNTKANTCFISNFPIIKLHTYNEVKKLIKKNAKDSLFLPMFDFIFSARKIFYYFSIYNVEYGYVNNLLSPVFTPTKRNKISLNNKKISFKYIQSALFHRVWRKLLPFKRAAFMCFCGENGKKFCLTEGACGRNIKQIDLYSFDYENFLLSQDLKKSKDYCVFIDQYIPFHPDNVVHEGYKIDPDIYYQELELFLDRLAKKYKLEIVISAHPQANYSKTKYLKKYKIEYGKTAELVKNSKLVCAHYSTAVVYGVMANKKIILINNRILHNFERMQNGIKSIQELLKCEVVNNEQDLIMASTDFEFNHEAYAKCMIANIAIKHSDDRLLWQRVFEEIF